MLGSNEIRAPRVADPVLPRDTEAATLDAGRLFAGLSLRHRSQVVVAVSGGGDSLALLLLLKSFLDAQASGPRLLAVTVDHRLRPESGKEARNVAALCARHRIAHRIVEWEGEKPATGITAAARAARHRLLAEAAAAAGTDLVMTGHTRDDQAETVTMRAARGPGPGGAGIAPATLFDGRVWFVRPLLGIRRRALRAHLARAGIAWSDDPTNTDTRYERARTRLALDEAAVKAAAAGARAAAHARVELGWRAAALVETHAAMPAPGLAQIARGFFETNERDAALYAFRILLAVTGGCSHLPREERSAALFDRLAGGLHRGTLSRAVADGSADAIYLYREARNLPRLVLASRPMLWDGRYRVTACRPGRSDVAPFGPGGLAEAPAQDPAPSRLLRHALAAEPALWRGDERLGLASAHPEVVCRPVVGPWALFLPSFDLEPARALSKLVGADVPLPAPMEEKDLDAADNA